jgi:hypothetical protein
MKEVIRQRRESKVAHYLLSSSSTGKLFKKRGILIDCEISKNALCFSQARSFVPPLQTPLKLNNKALNRVCAA